MVNRTPLPATLLARYQYASDTSQRRTSVAEQVLGRLNRSINWGYDDLGRLTSEQIAGSSIAGLISYTHDALGNRRTRRSTVPGVGDQTVDVDPFSRLSTDAYDTNGNTRVASVAGIGTVTDAYTFDNRLRERTRPDGSRVRLTYDGDGNKVAETVIPVGGGSGTTTYFLIDTRSPTGNTQTLEELNAALAVTKRYASGLTMIAQQTLGAQTDGTPARTLYLGQDAHGGVRWLSDASGTVVGFRDYDAFGVLLDQSGPSLAECRLSYAGEEWVPALGMSYHRNRWLDVDRGRFWTEDPLRRHAPMMSGYAYVRGDPVNLTDPTGLYEVDVHRYLTQYLAGRAGFNNDTADKFGIQTQELDTENDPRNAIINGDAKVENFDLWHFVNPQRLSYLRAGAFAPGATNIRVGEYFHSLEDTYAHAQGDSVGEDYFDDRVFGARKGHGLHGHDPDWTWTRGMKAFQMGERVFGEFSTLWQSRNPGQTPTTWTAQMTHDVALFASFAPTLTDTTFWYKGIIPLPSTSVSFQGYEAKVALLGLTFDPKYKQDFPMAYAPNPAYNPSPKAIIPHSQPMYILAPAGQFVGF